MYTPSSTPPISIRIVPVLPLLSCSEYIESIARHVQAYRGAANFRPQNCSFTCRILDPIWYMVPRGPPESTSQMVSQSVQLFLLCSRSSQTDRQKDHVTPSVATGRIHLVIIIIIIIIIIIRKFIMRTCSQALSLNRRRGQSLDG